MSIAIAAFPPDTHEYVEYVVDMGVEEFYYFDPRQQWLMVDWMVEKAMEVAIRANLNLDRAIWVGRAS